MDHQSDTEADAYEAARPSASRTVERAAAGDPNQDRGPVLRRVVALGSGGAIVVALVGLLGYVPGLELLSSIREGYIPMAPSTAACFLVLGGILLATARRSLPRVQLVLGASLAGVVSVFGALEVAGHFIGLDLNFEGALVPAAGHLGEVPVGRMSPSTGAVFFLAGLATVASFLRSWSRRRTAHLGHCGGILGSLVWGIGLVSCLAYLCGSPLLYGQGATIPMALTTALAFLMLAAATVAASGRSAIPLSLLLGPNRPGRPMNARRRFVILTLTMAGACAVVLGVTTVMLYRREMDERQDMLRVTVKSQARLIESVARHVLREANTLPAGKPGYDSFAEVMAQVVDAHEHYRGFGATGELTMARRDGDSIAFLLRHRHDTVEHPAPVAFDSDSAEPMRRALLGLSGTLIGLDYRGETVLAAHEPVAVLDLGIVAKIDLAELRWPFFRSGLSAAALALLVILAGATLFVRIGNPIIERLEAQAEELKYEVVQRRESEGKLVAFMASATEGFVIYDSDLKLSSINKTALGVFPPGSTEEGLRGKHILEIAPSLKETGRYDEYLEVVRTGESVHFDDIVPDARLGHRHLSVRAFGAGEDLGIIFTDITERRRAEDELRRLNQQNALILAAAGEGIYGLAPDGGATFVNPAAARMIGWDPEEIVGRNQHELLHHTKPDGTPYPAASCPIYAAYRDGNTHKVDDEVFWRKDGSSFPVEYISTPIRGEDGVIEGAVVTFNDISERKRAEEAQAQLHAQLKAKNKELEQVVYVASHDLRSPLVNIDGYSKELAYAINDISGAFGGDCTPTEAVKTVIPLLTEAIPEALHFIRTSAAKMDSLLTGLLRLSRSGRAALTIDSLDMKGLMARVIDACEFQISESGTELEVAQLPPCRGDVVQVNQVFSNLLDNALHYLDPDRPGTIRISGRVEGERSIYCVEDNGIGIAPAHQGVIFEVFHRLDPAETEGEGLGLAIIRQALGRLSGDIWVESERGRGSRFYVALPAVQEGR